MDDQMPADTQEDTLGGDQTSPHMVGGSVFENGNGDAAMAENPHPEHMMDPNMRYATPPVPQAGHNLSRPPSQLSSQSYPDRGAAGAPGASSDNANGRNHVVIKVGMVGDAQIGKTSLMVKYVEGSWDEDYIQTLGVNFMEKTISIRNTEITFSIWDLGGQREFVNMLPLVCNDAVAILFMFDLTRKSTLNSIKEWYRQGRGFNKTAIPILVGTKYDHFVNFPREDQEEISNQVSSCSITFVRRSRADGSNLGTAVCKSHARCIDLQQYES